MKRLSLFVFALCTCVTFCTDKDTGPQNVWRRTLEPRLSNTEEWRPCRRKPPVAGRVVEETQCGTAEPDWPPVPESAEACDEIVATHAQALRILSFQPRCTDVAIHALERFARTDAGAMSDVAAAYYVRAQRNDQPSDFLLALDAAEQAVAAAPDLPAARFNRALAQEALGLSEEAIRSWEQFLKSERSRWWEQFLKSERSDWAYEARQHYNRLIQQSTLEDAQRWQRNRDSLPGALRAGDRAAVARLIAPFPYEAQRYFDEVLLPQWAAAPARQNLDPLRLFATELSSRMDDDPFVTGVSDAISKASPEQLAALQQGHLAFESARLAEREFDYSGAAVHYKKAAELLARGNSPFRLRAELGYAVGLSFNQSERPRVLPLLLSIDEEAAKHSYRHLRARVEWIRGIFLDQVNFLESLAAYDAAAAEYARLHDDQGLIAIHTRRAGVLRILGHHELAWRAAFYAVRKAHHLLSPKDRNILLLETSLTAMALGHPRTALLYLNADVRFLQRELRDTLAADAPRVQGLRQQLSAVLRHRAAIQLHLERSESAVRDLDESARLFQAGGNRDVNVRRILQARADEVRGQALMRSRPLEAVVAFSKAMEGVSSDFRTFRASLLAQRAEAELLAGLGPDAERDLRQSLDVLREEESFILATRQSGEGEDLWTSYFARFQDTYRVLIRHLVDEGRPAAAFTYAERARAFEVLDLVKRLSSEPRVPGLEATSDENSAGKMIAEIQASLPTGTFLIQYCVLEDRTYTWVIARDAFQLLTSLRVKSADTVRWSAELQEAARSRNKNAADTVLLAAFAGLAAEPLDAIARMPGGRHPNRLVFMPDGAIHGLPLVALRNPETRRYLLEEAPVEISGSTSLYLSSLARDRALAFPANPSVLIIGDPEFDGSLTFAQGMKRLPYAKSEANEIHSLYAPYADMLTDAAATVPAFLERAAQHDIVHIAGHAIVNPRRPSHSLLLLAPSPNRSGAIDAQELLTRLKLDRTRLVILSTCSSAGGLPVGPEGVAPLVRPLLAAGVPAVIGSLWDVDDATTEELMVSFHRHYEEGSDAAEAMRAAQLGLLSKTNHNPGLRSVLAWAPFQVIGHASSPFAARAPALGGTPLGIHSSHSLQRPDRLRPQ
jgi:CHAT domain-containing protein